MQQISSFPFYNRLILKKLFRLLFWHAFCKHLYNQMLSFYFLKSKNVI